LGAETKALSRPHSFRCAPAQAANPKLRLNFPRGRAKVKPMMNITEVLITEHAVFLTVFDQIERALPKLKRLEEAKMLAGLVEALLQDHGDAETNLAFVALDHALDQKGQLDRLHEDHDEIDDHLKQVKTAATLPDAQRLLKVALTASRQHFHREELTVFPLIEKVLQKETLMELGKVWMQQHLARAG
jgi:hemerythrin-like domain-containing protein